MDLFKVTDSVAEAVQEVRKFYHIYHSMRYVKNELVMRLMRAPCTALLERIRSEFKDIVADGSFELTAALPAEANDVLVKDLPRLCFRFNRKAHGRLRQLVNLLNNEVE